MIAAAKKSESPGVFRADECYTFRELRRRGFGATMLRSMQGHGMPVRRIGRDKIVLGAELLEFFASLPVEK